MVLLPTVSYIISETVNRNSVKERQFFIAEKQSYCRWAGNSYGHAKSFPTDKDFVRKMSNASHMKELSIKISDIHTYIALCSCNLLLKVNINNKECHWHVRKFNVTLRK